MVNSTPSRSPHKREPFLVLVPVSLTMTKTLTSNYFARLQAHR